MPVSVVQTIAVLSTRKTPAVLLHSRKTLVSTGAGHGPGLFLNPIVLPATPSPKGNTYLWGQLPEFGLEIGRGAKASKPLKHNISVLSTIKAASR